MLEVADARSIVLRFAARLPAGDHALTPAVLGQVFAEDVRADADSPPFAKSLMDGYAVRAVDVARPGVELAVVEEVAAGAVPVKAVGAGQATAIYTGAPLPAGADAVVMVERTTAVPGNPPRVRVNVPVRAGENVLPRGREMAAGDVILAAGDVVTPVALGLCAAVGRTSVSLTPRPRVGVLATGNELVEADVRPGPGQIRNSNGPMLAALIARAGATPRSFGIAGDTAGALAAAVAAALEASDVLVLSGGVSVGKYDLVPDVLRDLGVTVHVHKVRMKPGKPLLFGTVGDKPVFGLPGNPVSSLVGFTVFVRPALRALAGLPDGPFTRPAPLAAPLTASNHRPTFAPAKLDGGAVRPVPWFGSADLRGLAAADALIALPAGDVAYGAGERVEVVKL